MSSESIVSESADKEREKDVTIIVDGSPHTWPKGKITYAQVVGLAYPQNPDRTYSVMYERGQNNKEGVLPPGGSVEVKEGMVFHVTDTSES
jgi:hypothetical protein